MATEKTGIELSLFSNVAQVLNAAGKAAAQTRTQLANVGSGAKTAFDAVGKAAVFMNQALELGKKGLELFRQTIGASIEQSLQFRAVGDDTTKFFENMGREAKLVQARIGDALLPVIRGFSEALGVTTGKISDWIAANQKLIGSRLIEWIGGASKLLVSGLAVAAEVVGKAMLGWKAIISVVQIVVNKFFEVVFKQLNFFAGALGWVAEKLGAKGLAKGIKEAQGTIQGLGAEFSRSSDVAQGELANTGTSINKLERTIGKLERAAKSAIADGMVNAQKRVAQATTGTTRTIEEQTAAIEKQKQAVIDAQSKIDELMKRRIAAIEKSAALQEKDARAADAGQQAPGSGGQTAGSQIAGAALGGVGGPAGSIASGFASGGPIGGIAAAVGSIISESATLQKIFGKVNQVFGKLVKALDPVFRAVAPIVDLMMNLLAPAIDGLGKVAKMVGSFILGVAIGLAKVWNGIINAITSIFIKLGNIKVFGKRPLGFIKEWGEDLRDGATIDTAGMERARRDLNRSVSDMADSLDDGAETIGETVESMARELLNVPTVIKVALREFRAADEEGTQVLTARGNPQGTFGGSRTMFAEIVNINTSALTPDELLTELGEEIDRVGAEQNGSMAGARGTLSAGGMRGR